MADYGVDVGGFPLSSLEAVGDMTPGERRRIAAITPEQMADLFPTGAELERRRAELKIWCEQNGWEFVDEISSR